MKERTVLKYDGFSYTDTHLRQIGNAVASLWGGSCYDYRVSRNINSVIFYCIEFGEHFVTEVTFEKLKEYLKG